MMDDLASGVSVVGVLVLRLDLRTLELDPVVLALLSFEATFRVRSEGDLEAGNSGFGLRSEGDRDGTLSATAGGWLLD
jgi:hypothetical protein